MKKHTIKIGSAYTSLDVYVWAEKHPLLKKDIYENNAYDLKHKCEQDLGCYVSQDDIANAYKSLLKYDADIIISDIYADGYCWKIYYK